MKTKDCFTELAIQISTLNMKLDAILKLLNTPEITYEIKTPVMTAKSVQDFLDTPKQWPNESYTDYLKRIGQYNETLSDNDKFEEFK